MRTTTLLNLVYSIPGMIAYLLTIIAIVKLRKKLSPSFTAIYLITAFVNLATHINTWIMYRLRLEPVFFFYYQWMMQPEMEFFKWPAKADFVFNATIGMYDIASNPNTSVIPVMISMLVFGAVMLIICSIMSVCMNVLIS
ncbi:hypothetical protein PFISCL1PPCAC_17553 [Pristionchus fissidentatus]|uniref:Serpentine receptor class gamma n=1 Tax=Pristionchus fissidentatus TaxID=1538716 RepID=A0AAV5W650_9BILA|nr:hypothetical protein PFISCL1PPCAC_17553 [Pristionchus fissidentatus]